MTREPQAERARAARATEARWLANREAPSPAALALPGFLRPTYQRLLTSEATAMLRHDLAGKLGALGMLAHVLERRLPASLVEHPDPKIAEALELVKTTLGESRAIILRAHDAMGGPPPKPAAVDVSRAARRVASEDEKGRIVVAPDSSWWIRGDLLSFEVALFVLLENALDACPSGPVYIGATTRGERIAITVSDEGPLAPPEGALAPFFSTKAGRMGLGLNLARRVATEVGGTLALERENGRTRATLTLPSAAPTEATGG